MFCSHCGREIEENEKFCSYCGYKVKKHGNVLGEPEEAYPREPLKKYTIDETKYQTQNLSALFDDDDNDGEKKAYRNFKPYRMVQKPDPEPDDDDDDDYYDDDRPNIVLISILIGLCIVIIIFAAFLVITLKNRTLAHNTGQQQSVEAFATQVDIEEEEEDPAAKTTQAPEATTLAPEATTLATEATTETTETTEAEIPKKTVDYSVVIDSSSLRVRKQPSTDAEVIKTLAHNEVVSIVAEYDGWGELASGGWILLEYTYQGTWPMDEEEETSEQPDETGRYDEDENKDVWDHPHWYKVSSPDGTLNVRSQPNSSSPVIETMKNGQKFTVESVDDNGWGHLSNGGYVKLKYATDTGEVDG